MMNEHLISTPYPSFKSINNMVYIDEKWYDMTRVKNTYYVLPGEPEPERTVSNTNSIGKTEAQRNSQNRDRGTIEVKPVKVTRHVCRQYLINKVIPAIQDKWPDDDEGTTIFIQQDNAKPHVLPNDEGFREAVEQTDLDIRLIQQPPNSPEFNVLDMCFHRSLQSLTDCRAPINIRELVQGVEEEFENYDAHKLFKSFITLQAVIEDQGGNSYKMPHLHKDRLQNAGEEIIGVY
uniref:Transposase n=1 Tax=Hordeum vulgare subsp. vulgare TaxID=112509 RepID=A0A8I6X107_HORVV